MDVDDTKSTLFQIPLRPEEVTYFENPKNQPDYNPMNCGAVSGQLLGFVSKQTSEIMTEKGIGMGIEEWVQEFNRVSGSQEYSSELTTLAEVEKDLFPGCATLVLFTRSGAVGHYCVLAKDSKNNIYILDPQARMVISRGGFSEYFKQQLFTDFVFVIRTAPRTEDEHFSAYIDDILSSRLTSECRIAGKRKRSTRKRKTRSLRKRNTRKRR